jgi:hypothetical protein
MAIIPNSYPFSGGAFMGDTEGELKIFACTEPAWPRPAEMFDSYNNGKDIVIVRQSLSGVNYSVWSLENVVKDLGPVENFTMEFQNDEGSSTANRKTKRVKFYSADNENWTITENTFYYPERATVAPDWDPSDVSNYKQGTLVYRAGVLYICKTDTPSSSWVASEWEETDIANEVEKTALKLFTCTEPAWPSPSSMYSAFERGQDIAIIRQSLSGVIYSVWRLATTADNPVPPKNYTLEFQNDEGSDAANRKTNRVKFYSTDKENWTTTETTFVYPFRETVAPNWSSSDVSNYKKGTLVYRAGILYRCKTNAPSGSWVVSEWEQTTIAEELARKGDSDMKTIELFANSACSYEFTGNARAATFSKVSEILDFKTLSTGAAANTSVGFKAGDTINIVAAKIKGGQAAGLQSPAMASGVTGLCASLQFELVALDSAGDSVESTYITTNLKELDWNVFEKKGIELTTPSTLPAGATCFGIRYGGAFSCDDYNIQDDYVGQTVTPELVLEIATESETVVDVATGTEIEY